LKNKIKRIENKVLFLAGTVNNIGSYFKKVKINVILTLVRKVLNNRAIRRPNNTKFTLNYKLYKIQPNRLKNK